MKTYKDIIKEEISTGREKQIKKRLLEISKELKQIETEAKGHKAEAAVRFASSYASAAANKF